LNLQDIVESYKKSQMNEKKLVILSFCGLDLRLNQRGLGFGV
jgi:hypothetical protein